MKRLTCLVLVLALALSATVCTRSTADAKPTPIPGGANQKQAVSGTLGQMLFNGKVRLEIDVVREETPEEAADLHPFAGQKVVHIEGILRNAMHETVTIRPEYTLADKDDVTQKVGVLDVPVVTLEQGAAGKQKIRTLVPKDFVPVKLIVTPGQLFGPAFRITLTK